MRSSKLLVVKFLARLAFLALAFAVLPTENLCAQTARIVDTVFTPENFPDGALSGTLYFPSTPNGTAVVLVHGLFESRRFMDPWADTLATHGYVAMEIDYPDPVNGTAKFPAPSRAIKTAVQFLRRNCAVFGIATDRIGALGRSLGSALIAESMADEDDFATFGIPGDVEDKIDFGILQYGLYDYSHYTTTNLPLSIPTYATTYFAGNSEVQSRETPVLQSSRVEAPVLLIHGELDQTIDYHQTLEFADSLHKNGKNRELLLFPADAHVFEISYMYHDFTPDGLIVKDSALAFIARATTKFAVKSPTPTDFAVRQNYPNPFGSRSASGIASTKIMVDIPLSEETKITIFNALGETVKLLDLGTLGGSHEVTVDCSDFASGAYFYLLQSGSIRIIRSMTVVN